MSQPKSLVHHLVEAYENYKETQIVAAVPQKTALFHHLKWFIPNGGTILLALFLILTQHVWATPAQSTNTLGASATTINYQGRLAAPDGTPQDGTFGMTFSLWDAANGGSIVWGSESHSAVPVTNGLFNVGLGSQTSGGIPTTVWNGDRYLEITVNGETLTPRELIRSVPFASIAGMALTVPDGSITLSKLGEQPYYFNGSLATPSEWMADVVFNGNYERFCQAIERTFVRAETLQDHYTEAGEVGRGNGYFYDDWYYLGPRYHSSDTHVYGNSDPNSGYGVWKYNGGGPSSVSRPGWTYERSAIIWCN